MMSNSWDHTNKMAFTAGTGIGPLYTMNSSSCKKLLAIEGNSVPCRHLSSASRNFSNTISMGVVGNFVRKIVNAFIPTDAQIQNLEKNRQSLSAPDILVDISVNTPIFETSRGIAKLRIPEEREASGCDQTKSLSVGNSPFDWCPITRDDLDKMDTDEKIDPCRRGKPQRWEKIMPDSKFPYSDGRCSVVLKTEQRLFTAARSYKNFRTEGKNRKQKNRRNQLINMMEDIRSMTDDSDSDFEFDSQCSSPYDVQEKICNGASFQPVEASTLKTSPSISNHPDPDSLEGKLFDENSFVIFAENVQLTTPSASPARRRDICAAINSFFVPGEATRQRRRQISECSDESIVFCYDSEEDSAEAAIGFQQDFGSDSETDDSDSDICDGESDATLSQQPDSGFEERKVRFNPIPEVHVIRAWDFAYRQARKGDWEMAARDRERFRKRIEDTGRLLGTVFEQKQRERIFRERFSES